MDIAVGIALDFLVIPSLRVRFLPAAGFHTCLGLACSPSCLRAGWGACLLSRFLAFLLACLPACLPACLLAFLLRLRARCPTRLIVIPTMLGYQRNCAQLKAAHVQTNSGG